MTVAKNETGTKIIKFFFFEVLVRTVRLLLSFINFYFPVFSASDFVRNAFTQPDLRGKLEYLIYHNLKTV